MNTATRELSPAAEPVKFSPSDLARFWAKVDKNGPLPDQSNPHYDGLDQCWDWKGRTDAAGYAEISMNQTRMGVHRVSVLIHGGNIPHGMIVLHSCDKRNCVNPLHLRVGTHKENTSDMCQKGRAAYGDKSAARKYPHKVSRGDHHYSRKNPELLARGDANGARMHPEMVARGSSHRLAKLTESDILEIRSSYAGKTVTMPTLGRKFGVSTAKIHQIIHRKSWAHVD